MTSRVTVETRPTPRSRSVGPVDRRPHVVLIAMYFPPSRASGVYRALAMANFLARAGWRVTVVTVTEDFFDRITGSRDDSLLDAVDPAVRVVRVPLPVAHLETDVRHMGQFRTTFPRLHEAVTRGHQRRVFPEVYNTWIVPAARATGEVHRRTPVDVVVATGNPWSAFAAAWLVNRRHRIPYVMDYRDSWTLDLFAEADAFPAGHLARRWERLLLRGATGAYFVNRALLEWHAERYPDVADRMGVLPNGYDPDFVGEPSFRPPGDGPLRFGYVGTITDKLPHQQMWQGWAAVRDDPAMAQASAHLYGHLGFFPASRDRVRSMLPLERSDVHYEGPVAKSDVAATYEQLDVLLLMAADSRYVTSGKVFECMASGRPLVGVHSPSTAIAEPLRGYPLYFPAERLDAEAVGRALVAAAHGARTATREQVDACRAHARTYRRDSLLVPFEADLREVAGA